MTSHNKPDRLVSGAPVLRLVQTKSGAELEPFQVTIREAAKLLSISYRQMLRMLERGDIPSIGKGRLRRVAIADLRAWQSAQRTGGRDAA